MTLTTNQIIEHLFEHLPQETKQDKQIFLQAVSAITVWHSLSQNERDRIDNMLMNELLDKLGGGK